MKYQTPNIELIKLQTEDIMALSGILSGDENPLSFGDLISE